MRPTLSIVLPTLVLLAGCGGDSDPSDCSRDHDLGWLADLASGTADDLAADDLAAGSRDAGVTPRDLARPAPQGLAAILSKQTFDAIFPDRNAFYTYEGLIAAADSYAAFATTGDTTRRKRELAAFLANVAHETGDLVYIEEINKSEYCAPSNDCPCAPGKRYYGRGPIQISWSYNYCAFGEALGFGHELQAHPERVAQDATIAWQTGLWFWMTSTGAGQQTCHDGILGGSFGETIRTINGSLECNRGGGGGVQSRVDHYRHFCDLLGVDPGNNLYC